MLGKDHKLSPNGLIITQPNLENLIEIARCPNGDLNDLVRLGQCCAVKPYQITMKELCQPIKTHNSLSDT